MSNKNSTLDGIKIIWSSSKKKIDKKYEVALGG
jgi:hypothetical protein